ncbi:uncharacterized protein BX664DRAFT_345260 [Halteromyces radiatus]|uniref:uncharacterized protein n=1 Tax=Halteromyces radiatus TaxID=101107 RepID=UPI002220C49D|nr:uncharacterized protein BX664DRAFT_345260 [Halteromyces radiatus]KAI8099161.1 hypothetical protein BX664DRAFT_345260 [Halteromyces radiatus]
MYVCSAPVRMQAAGQLRWYATEDILQYVYRLRNYLIQSPGKLSPTFISTHRLNPIDTSFLFDGDKRFPAQTVYICEAIGGWNDMFQRLRLLTSIIVHNNRLLRGYSNITTQGVAEMTLLRIIDEIIQAYEAAEGFIDRDAFEERYELEWQDQNNNNDDDDES